jgi:hypothetical protein
VAWPVAVQNITSFEPTLFNIYYKQSPTTNNMASIIKLPRSCLLALVDELLLEIVDFVESKDDLCKLARVCSRLQGLTEPALYRSVLIHKGSTALRILSAILSRPVRVSFIRQLQVRYMYAHRHGISVLNEILMRMRNLQELTIEAPCCNDTYAFVDEDFETKGLIDYADYFVFASSMTLESHPRVQVPLQSCKSTPKNPMPC